MTEQTNKTVVITGGSRGIGRVICCYLAGTGVDVYFNYFNPGDPEGEAAEAAETEKQVAEIGSGAKSFSVDVASREQVADFFSRVLDETGRIDVLVNNAGITRDSLLVRMKEGDWDSVLNINLKGAYQCSQLAAKAMMKQRSWRIVNIASIAGVIGSAGQANYAASKAGLIALTKVTARELAPRGVTVNAIAPGYIETDMTAALSEKVRAAYLEQIPLKRGGKPDDIAKTVRFLVSEDAAYITGQVIHVNGGLHM
ncbi:MAG: 3-oxoacyl-[acyl-carrier-protein] reductase [Deltaproteobacteria bacterium]|nr:3-oxoacyl-[acyl-carrier-protein] reductase [Deltaproteobacteria bacterium]